MEDWECIKILFILKNEKKLEKLLLFERFAKNMDDDFTKKNHILWYKFHLLHNDFRIIRG